METDQPHRTDEPQTEGEQPQPAAFGNDEPVALEPDTTDDWDTDESEQPDSFKRLHTEVQEGRLSVNQAVSDVIAILAGETVDRHLQEDDPEEYDRVVQEREQTKSPTQTP